MKCSLLSQISSVSYNNTLSKGELASAVKIEMEAVLKSILSEAFLILVPSENYVNLKCSFMKVYKVF